MVIQIKFDFITEMKQNVSAVKLSWILSIKMKMGRNYSTPNVIGNNKNDNNIKGF